MKPFTKLLSLTGLLLVLIHATALAQCDDFEQEQFIDQLGDYQPEGQFRMTSLQSGEKSEMIKLFKAGIRYRILLCLKGEVSTINLTIKTTGQEVLHKQTSQEDSNTKWDFTPETDQMLIISVEVPDTAQAMQKGCVGVLIGHHN